MRIRGWRVGIALVVAVCATGGQPSPAPAATTGAPDEPPQAELKLWRSRSPALAVASAGDLQIQVVPGNQAEADAYYKEIRSNLANFPKATLPESTIEDMLAYFGFPAIPPTVL